MLKSLLQKQRITKQYMYKLTNSFIINKLKQTKVEVWDTDSEE